MIVGIGVDLVDVPRFERTLARTPRLRDRLFSVAERPLKPRSLAARYAAKEALIKALGGSDGVHWTEIEVASEPSGKPGFALCGSTAAVVAARGITALHLSMSHDAGLATAYVIAEALPAPSVSAPSQASLASPEFASPSPAPPSPASPSPASPALAPPSAERTSGDRAHMRDDVLSTTGYALGDEGRPAAAPAPTTAPPATAPPAPATAPTPAPAPTPEGEKT